MENFSEKLLHDTELLSDLPLLRDLLNDKTVMNDVYELCREVFLINYEAEISKNDGRLQAFYPNERFEILGNQINKFVRSTDLAPQVLLDELLLIMKNYYIMTASPDEKKDRTLHLKNEENNKPFGVVSTLYNLNQIDWDVFSEGIKENVQLV